MLYKYIKKNWDGTEEKVELEEHMMFASELKEVLDSCGLVASVKGIKETLNYNAQGKPAYYYVTRRGRVRCYPYEEWRCLFGSHPVNWRSTEWGNEQ